MKVLVSTHLHSSDLKNSLAKLNFDFIANLHCHASKQKRKDKEGADTLSNSGNGVKAANGSTSKGKDAEEQEKQKVEETAPDVVEKLEKKHDIVPEHLGNELVRNQPHYCRPFVAAAKVSSGSEGGGGDSHKNCLEMEDTFGIITTSAAGLGGNALASMNMSKKEMKNLEISIAYCFPALESKKDGLEEAIEIRLEKWISTTSSMVDILLLDTTIPSNVERSSPSALALLNENPSKSLFGVSTSNEKQLSDLAQALILKFQPRYIICNGGSVYWEREPFKYLPSGGNQKQTEARVGRFISLAEPSKIKANKWSYAFNIEPLISIAAAPASAALPSTACPFIPASSKKRKQDETVENPNFFFGSDSNTTKKMVKDTDIPPEGYLCRICNTPGHYVSRCPDNKKQLSDTYVCKICGIKGHDIRDCPNRTEGSAASKRLKGRNLQACWFCLSNPAIESHMILGICEGVYVAAAKGALVEEHVLIVPVVHCVSSCVEGGADVVEETKKITKEISKVHKGRIVVAYEIFGGGDPANPQTRIYHMHVNVVPLQSSASVESVTEEFDNEAEKHGLIKVEASTLAPFWPFIKVNLYSDGQQVQEEFLYAPPEPKQGQPLVPFNITFTRGVVAKILELADRVDWKRCVLEEEEESAVAERLRLTYKFLLQDE